MDLLATAHGIQSIDVDPFYHDAAVRNAYNRAGFSLYIGAIELLIVRKAQSWAGLLDRFYQIPLRHRRSARCGRRRRTSR